MAQIKAFKCVRPRKELASKIAALPYDVYSSKEAREVVEDNPLSFLRIDRAETQFDKYVQSSADCVYEKAHDLLESMIEDGYLITDEDDAYYIYELTMDGRSQAGIVACASIDDYENGVIKKHENTRIEKELDRIRHVDSCNAQTGPIFLTYRSLASVNELVNKKRQERPLYDFTSEDGVRHSVWKIADQESVQMITDTFAGISQIYIADGHHRAASAVKVGRKRREEHPGYTGKEEFNYFLSVLFPHDQLKIMDYNRVISDIRTRTLSQFLRDVQRRFDVELKDGPYSPQKKGEIGMYLGRKWYCIRLQPQYYTDDPVDGLDVSILQNNLLDPYLGIEDPARNKRIDFVGGIRGLGELERRVKEGMMVAFSMYPTSIEELFAVADAGKLMPPKSTWFEPKLRSGLFIHKLE